MKKNKRGFTIVELVIVIAVIGILAAVLIPTFSGVVENANKSAILEEAKNSMTDYLIYNDAKVDAKIGTSISDGETVVWNGTAETAKWVVYGTTADKAIKAFVFTSTKYDGYQVVFDESGNDPKVYKSDDNSWNTGSWTDLNKITTP